MNSAMKLFTDGVDTVLQMLRLNGYVEKLKLPSYQKKKYRVEYKLIREIPRDFTYTKLITINNSRKNNGKI